MLTLYQATFYLSTLFLAITITVFILAVSLLGRAVRISTVEQEKNQKEILSRNKASMEELKEKASKGQFKPDIASIQKSINIIKRRQRFSRLKLWWICIKPHFLEVPLGVLLPGSLFIISIASSALAIYFESSSHDTALSLWYTSIVIMIIGAIFIIFILRVTQSVALTSEEISHVRQKEVFTSALHEYYESQKPELVLEFYAEQPPFTLSVDQQKEIDFNITLSKSDIARKPVIWFFAPAEFDFPGKGTIIQTRMSSTTGGYRSTTFEFKDCTKGVFLTGKLLIKAPSQPNKYVLYYQVMSELFVGDEFPFEVRVE